MDPQHLYQRLILMGVGDIPLPDLLQYELCSLPASLFDNHMCMRTGDKAELIHDHILKLVPDCIVPSLPTTELHCNLYMVMAKHVQKVCITTLKKKLDPSLSEALLFLHAISGCDTTSRPHGIGKVTVLKKYAALKNSTYIFMSPSSSKEAIEKAGEKALLVIYGCPTSPNLNSARVKKFQVMVATSAEYVPPEKLPPTTEAASHHSHRTYHQIYIT
ncbi:hypothetical protein QZH41_007479 [Actinostola sp. cb2023]|nr:hypothetical protein QZH41_007479 [Actinostola sp. cb2023]